MGMMSRYAAVATLSSPADKKIKTLKQSDAISPEIKLGCGDKNMKKVFIYAFHYLFIEKTQFQSADRNYGFNSNNLVNGKYWPFEKLSPSLLKT